MVFSVFLCNFCFVCCFYCLWTVCMCALKVEFLWIILLLLFVRLYSIVYSLYDLFLLLNKDKKEINEWKLNEKNYNKILNRSVFDNVVGCTSIHFFIKIFSLSILLDSTPFTCQNHHCSLFCFVLNSFWSFHWHFEILFFLCFVLSSVIALLYNVPRVFFSVKKNYYNTFFLITPISTIFAQAIRSTRNKRNNAELPLDRDTQDTRERK